MAANAQFNFAGSLLSPHPNCLPYQVLTCLCYNMHLGQRPQIPNTQHGAFSLGSAVIQNTQSPGSPQNLVNPAPLAIQKLQSNLPSPCPRLVLSGCLLYCGAFSHRVLPSFCLCVIVLCPTSERKLKSYTTVAPG